MSTLPVVDWAETENDDVFDGSQVHQTVLQKYHSADLHAHAQKQLGPNKIQQTASLTTDDRGGRMRRGGSFRKQPDSEENTDIIDEHPVFVDLSRAPEHLLLQKLKQKESRHGHSTQPSLSSKPSSDSHNPMWLSYTNELWDKVHTNEERMEKAEENFEAGGMQAFGEYADVAFQELDKLRRAQHGLFDLHSQLEATVLQQVGKDMPDANIMEEIGLNPSHLGDVNDKSLKENSTKLLDKMHDLCSQIQHTRKWTRADQVTKRLSKTTADLADAATVAAAGVHQQSHYSSLI
eukprot:m.63541 g.63541  ORF g.63541 m.63541 type:complete len:292 (-) comp23296_c0_seq1:74-949(-)